MIPADSLKNLLSKKLSDKDKALVCLAIEPLSPRKINEITSIAFSSGWRQVKKKNLSSIYSRSGEFAVRLEEGWELTSEGKQHVAELAGPLMNSPIPRVASSLREHLSNVIDLQTRSFVEEAVSCFETKQYRAAIVLSWVGAISVLQAHVVKCKLKEFNAESFRRNKNWKSAKSSDDLGLIKEDTFLDILQSIGVIGKNVKLELKKGLTLRNGCGHPNSLIVAEHKVSAHIEDLILNVFSVF